MSVKLVRRPPLYRGDPRSKAERFLWTRCGDAADYVCCGKSLATLVDVLDSARVRPPFRTRLGGVTCPSFRGNNYVSLYWGDTEGNLISGLRPAELSRLRDELDRR